MKSPLHDNFQGIPLLKEMIPSGSIVEAYLFFAGKTELSLASDERFVIAHTNRYPVYEFWKCVEEDPFLVAELARSFFPMASRDMFYIFQEKWHTYADPFMRAALMFVLNRCSEKGTISCGPLFRSALNPLAMNTLESFKMTNMNFQFDDEEDVLRTLSPTQMHPESIVLIGAGSYEPLFFPQSTPRGPEESLFDPTALKTTLASLDKKWILLYSMHPKILSLYENYNIVGINQYGSQIHTPEQASEVLIANF